MSNLELYKELDQKNVELKVKIQQLEQKLKDSLAAINKDELDSDLLSIYEQITEFIKSEKPTDEALSWYDQIGSTLKAKQETYEKQYRMYGDMLKQYSN